MIEVRRRHIGGYKTAFSPEGPWHRIPGFTLYVVVQDGKRVDSYMKRRNAIRCAARLAAQEGRSTGTQCATPPQGGPL